ncbi:hypothetical protein GCM10029964_019770 [Kibdelosporangium lantanae]
MRPDPRVIICRATQYDMLAAPSTLTVSVRCQVSCHSAYVTSSTGDARITAALFTNTSTAPKVDTAEPTISSTANGSARSPSADDNATTLSPNARNASATARPIPRVPPVTRTPRLTWRTPATRRRTP